MTGVQTCALPICFPVTICGVGVRAANTASGFAYRALEGLAQTADLIPEAIEYGYKNLTGNPKSSWSDVVVSLVLGDSWMIVADYLPFLSWFFFISSIASSTSSVFYLYRRGWFELFFNCLLAAIPVVLIVFLFEKDFSFYLLWYSILSGVCYLYFLVWTYVKCDSLER